MQNQTTTVATARRGIPLDQQLFSKAISKAREVRPPVLHVGAHYAVRQSDQRSWAHVIFCVWDGRIHATCSCYAHTRGDRGKPVPCYHIAAAALSKGAAALVAAQACAPVPVVRPSAHTHACPYCCDVYPCNCKHPEIDDQVCDACGSRALDWSASYGNEKNYWQ